MTLFLDSAFIDDARQAAELGFVVGITTNPTLINKVLKTEPRAGGIQIKTREDLISAMCDVFPGTIMVQLTAETAAERKSEAQRLLGLRPGQIGLKIPSTSENFPLAYHFAKEGYTVGMTTIFSPGQAFLACEAGASIIFPYVNRSTRLLGDGFALVRQMRAIVDGLKSPIQILAASIKSGEEATNTILAGAHGLTIPLDIIQALGENPHSQQSILDFAKSE
ncbi:MAG: transaldolase [Chloroflexi bacterium]|nr:transaldolase [Chloroflexota bacterium]